MSRAEDTQARSALVARLGDALARSGMQRMASRAFAAVLTSEEGRMTAAEVGQLLQASPAAVSGAMRYLEQVGLILRTRDPGSRRDHFDLADDIWYESVAHNNGVIQLWQQTVGEAAQALGVDSPAGQRLEEMREFCAFVDAETPALLERWRAHRATLLSRRVVAG